MSDLNNEYSCFLVLDVGKSKLKVPANFASGESPPFGLQIAAFSLFPHIPEREKASSLVLPYKGTNPMIRAHLMPSSKPTYISKAPS